VSGTVRAGIAVSLSGRYGRFGRQALAGLQCWAEDLRRAGGLRVGATRLPLEIVVADDEGDTDCVRRRVEDLVRTRRVDLLFGPYGSGLTLAAADVAESAGMILWNHGGASDEIHQKGHRRVIGVLTPASRYLLPVLDRLGNVHRVAVVHAETGFSRQVADGVLGQIRARGLELVLHRRYPPDAHDLGEIARELERETPDLLLGAGRFEDDVRLASAITGSKRRPRSIALVAAGVSEFRPALGDRAEGVLGPSQWETGGHTRVDWGPSAEEFTAGYRSATELPLDYPAAQAYAAGLIAEKAIADAGTVDPGPLRDAAAGLRLTTFFGAFAIDPVTGMQTAHETVVVRWRGDRREVVAASASP
jgi:branched-chain amino acid transport system substrate-binding protein